MDDKLNTRQKHFCESYVACGNATESAIEAGYSKKTARSIGQRLLTNVDIKCYIKKLNEKTKTDKIMTAVERKEWLTEILKNDENKLQDKLKAMDILNKMTGEYTEKLELSGEINTSNPFKGLTTEELKRIVENENK